MIWLAMIWTWLWRLWVRLGFCTHGQRGGFGRRAVLPSSPLTQRKPARVRREIIRIRAATDSGCRCVALTFNRLYAAERSITVGKTFVAQTIRKHHYEIQQLRKRWKHSIPFPLAHNVVWGLDLTGKADASGEVHSILGILDHGSRLALGMRPLPDRATLAILKVLITVIDRFGKPKAIRTDNDACFTSRLFACALGMLGIRHQRTQPGMPWQNGRIERLFGTLKEKLDRLWVLDGESLGRMLVDFRLWYNHVRAHQHLAGRTPWEAWCGIDPYAQTPKSVDFFQAWDGLLAGYYLRR